MTSDLRDKWKKAKSAALRHVPKGFLPKDDFGPKLDKAEKAYEAWEKEKNPDKEDAAKHKAVTAGLAASHAGTGYLKLIHMAVQNNKDNKDLHKALYDLETTLSMQILRPLDDQNTRLSRKH